jgi:hypothetical protein
MAPDDNAPYERYNEVEPQFRDRLVGASLVLRDRELAQHLAHLRDGYQRFGDMLADIWALPPDEWAGDHIDAAWDHTEKLTALVREFEVSASATLAPPNPTR